ncbi:MAG: hypothetical protein PHQ60_07455 [Sideroxydans sp.]|nr:hypothetical protein [Sideroxydans sp.]
MGLRQPPVLMIRRVGIVRCDAFFAAVARVADFMGWLDVCQCGRRLKRKFAFLKTRLSRRPIDSGICKHRIARIAY